MEYWYTAQLRNYRLQFIRAFSNFYYQTGVNADGSKSLVQVPCRYGDETRIAAMVVQGNSENKLLTTPFITCYITGLTTSATRRQAPQLEESIQVDERQYDQDLQAYDNTPGNRYTIKRYMAVPYDLTMTVAIWTNNESVKEQLLEQIMTLYNPAIEIQTSNNPLDWTVLSYIEMNSDIQWTSRTIPMGTNNPIDVTTMTFKFPIWINPPAKVQRQSIIQTIITSMLDMNNLLDGNVSTITNELYAWTDYEFLNRKVITPGNFSITLAWIGNNTYALTLGGRAGDTKDDQHNATVTFSKPNPTLTRGTTFSFNGIEIPVTTTNLATFVDQCQTLCLNTSYNVQLQNFNQLMFINNTAGNNVFGNTVGDALTPMGLLATTYPGGDWAWWRLFLAYGTVHTYVDYNINASQLRVTLGPLENVGQYQASGWIDYHPYDQNKILWTVDPATLPNTTLSPITAVVNPLTKGPAAGLPPATVGQRYLLTEMPAIDSAAWGKIVANADDIIEFDGIKWSVSFSASNYAGNVQYVTNQFSGKLLIWDGQQWADYIVNRYGPGYWNLAL
jgi:hypothetical protein